MSSTIENILSVDEITKHLTNAQIRNRLILETTVFPAILTAILCYSKLCSNKRIITTFLGLILFGLLFELVFFYLTKHISSDPYGLIISNWILSPLADVLELGA